MENTIPKYEIWTADLNSLYLDVPGIPIFAEDCWTLEEARKARGEYQTHDQAAWIQEKETGTIIQ